VHARIWLGLYLAAAVALASLHQWPPLAAAALFLAVLAWRDAPRIARKTLLALAAFNGTVSIAYAVTAWMRGEPFGNYLLLFNLRVFDLTFLTFFFSSRVNIVQALAFSPTLSFLLAASLSQIQSFRRTFEEFGLALKSRTIRPLKERNRRDFVASMFLFFFKKARHNADEFSMALKARGFFDRV
jgi:cobalt/nickel transport system permease protein